MLKVKEYINTIKTNSKFAEERGIAVDRKILTWKERFDMCENNEKGNISPFTDKIINYQLDHWKVPKQRITFIYQTEIIQFYE
jgi:hypothetical protein